MHGLVLQNSLHAGIRSTKPVGSQPTTRCFFGDSSVDLMKEVGEWVSNLMRVSTLMASTTAAHPTNYAYYSMEGRRTPV
jgi:hypothetical protein